MKTAISPALYLLLCVIILNKIYSSTGFSNPIYKEPQHLKNLLATGQYEEFARLLRIDDVDLVKPSEGKRSGNPMLHKGLKGGDILPRSWKQKQEGQDLLGSTDNISKWNKSVPYVIHEDDFGEVQGEVILKAIAKWNEDLLPNIGFFPREAEEDYVIFFSGDDCYSKLGRTGGQQPISIDTWGCLSEGTVLHEMSHAVGIEHEHVSPDRDNYIKVFFQNIEEGWQDQFVKLSYEEDPILGPYDYYSLMHYEVIAPDSDLPAFEVLEEGIDLSRIGTADAQTQIDIDKIKRLYS